MDEIIKEAEYLASPSAEVLSDSDRLTRLILLAQRIPEVKIKAEGHERNRIVEILKKQRPILWNDNPKIHIENIAKYNLIDRLLSKINET